MIIYNMLSGNDAAPPLIFHITWLEYFCILKKNWLCGKYGNIISTTGLAYFCVVK